MNPFRAAAPAACFLLLCACASTGDSPLSVPPAVTVDAKPAEMIVAAPEAITPAAAPVADRPDTSVAPATPAANETLLYGAMTKWELKNFVEAISGAGLQSALEGETALTVFAPNNQAFDFAALGGEADIAALLGEHSVAGALDMAALKALAAKSDGGTRAKLTTQSGTQLTLYVNGDVVKIAGPNGVLARITQGDMVQSNGVMHQISSVLETE